MTVGELVEHLKGMPEDAQVVRRNTGGDGWIELDETDVLLSKIDGPDETDLPVVVLG